MSKNRFQLLPHRFVPLLLLLLAVAAGCNPKSDATDASADVSSSQPTAPTELATIQGENRRSSLSGQIVSAEGVVTLVTTDQWGLQGFFLQQTSASETGSSAVFVQSAVDDIDVGDRVRLTGIVNESAETGMTIIRLVDAATSRAVETIAEGQNVQPVELPDQSTLIDWEDYESMLVRVPHETFVVDTYNLARRGQVTVAAQPLRVPTEDNDPDDAKDTNSPAVQAADFATIRTIKIDDGIDANNLFPIPLLPGLGNEFQTLRVGSKINDLTGIVIEDDGEYLLVPTAPLQIDYASRPDRPDLGDADLAVASFNVLNFFSTIDDGRNNARGADSAEELSRQQTKLVSALVKLDADVIGLMELENNAASEQTLLKAINDRLGADVYAGCGIPAGFVDTPGGRNAIRVGLIYRKSAVEPTGPVELLDDKAFAIARTPLVQEFKSTDNGFRFTAIVNHFKSKGGSGAAGMDADQGDGQASYNATRCRQAQAVVDHVNSLVEAGRDKVLVIGDLNAYSEEDPIDLLRDAGLTDLTETACPIKDPYTFIYYGQAGCLDHSFASTDLAKHVTVVSPWNINSAEPRFLDYNTEYNPSQLYRPDEFRCSDHDPVLIGIKTQ